MMSEVDAEVVLQYLLVVWIAEHTALRLLELPLLIIEELTHRPFVHVGISFGDFAVWVGGHTHKDMHLLQNGVLTVCSAGDTLGRGKVRQTDTEQAFDIFTIDKNAHKIYITRIGAGDDREFTYEVF